MIYSIEVNHQKRTGLIIRSYFIYILMWHIIRHGGIDSNGSQVFTSSSWFVIFNRIGKGSSTPRCMTSWHVAIHTLHHIDVFGSGTELLARAEIISLDELDSHAIRCLNHLRMPREKWTIQESLTICRHLHGKHVSTSDYNRIRKDHPEMPSRATIVNKHGSWA